jgi:hypothetical protein
LVLDRIDRFSDRLSDWLSDWLSDQLLERFDKKFESLLHNCTTTVTQQLSRDVEWDVVIPIEHVVAAGNLFTSQYIQALFPEQIDEDYIMIVEETQGQGEENRHVTQASVPGYLQGVDFQVTMPSNGRYDQIDGLSWLEIDRERVTQLYESYMRHIHSLYPFLGESRLKTEIYHFVRLYCIPQQNLSVEEGCRGRRFLERSINNAIVLLVLAVGAICEWRDNPLEPVSNWTSYIHDPQGILASILTHEQSKYSLPKNTEEIPGFSHFVLGTCILGTLQGGCRLSHIHASLLAGLYAGQMASPFQSYAWISQASRACQMLMRRYVLKHSLPVRGS